ncbi:MAG TPA: TRAP transporter large permease subunit [Burkholderiales bacterium]|nr:TRAP transporter large permease subunit [Burkholderiales bacterium]
MESAASSRRRVVVDRLYYAAATLFFLYLFWYYVTSSGGPTLLAMTLIPFTFVLFTLDALRKDDLYPRLPAAANYAIAAAYVAVCIAVSVYMRVEYMDLGTVRAGMWDPADLFLGGAMVALVMEYARKRHMTLFILNVALMLYAVYGYLVPGMFYHAGLPWSRIVSAASVEMSTGIFARLPQIALTVIGSFLLVLSALRAYGCIDSLLRATKRVAVRSAHALPQSAVVGSMLVGTVSGSGAANAITIGTATIPAMIGAGMPRATAAAIESASSLGGQLMPPVMGVSAFLMAEFMGVSYFDVVARGYVPAIIYYATVAVSVYLLSLRNRTHAVALNIEGMTWKDWTNIGAFAAVISGLVGLMAVWHLAPMFAALYVFVAVASVLFAVNVAALLWSRRLSLRALVEPLARFVDTYTEMTADLALLLATLSIMTGALVITGVPTKMGSLLMDAAGVNLAAMVLMAFVFGAVLGTGLPPAPTYIIAALVIVPPMISVGVNPWVVHFFAFFLAVWGELTPPTSLVAAVTSKIAGAPFGQTLSRALQICVSLFTLMAGVFVRPELVIEPGTAQLGAAALILVATIGITFSLQARFSERPVVDLGLRGALAALAMVVLLHPSERVAALTCVPLGMIIAYWLVRRRISAASATAEARA